MAILKVWVPPDRKRQRLESYEESKTVCKLLDLIGHGRLSVEGAVDLANSMVADGTLHRAIHAFASLGAGGTNGNSERDLHRCLKCLFNFELRPYTLWLNLEEARTTDGSIF